MQRQLLFAVLVFCAAVSAAPAQETPPSVLADAQRQEAEERYRRMSAKVEDLEAAIQAWQQRFNALDGEINKLRRNSRA